MIQEIGPRCYHNEFEQRAAQTGDTLLAFREEKALLRVENGVLTLPKLGEISGVTPEACRSLFSVDGEYFSMPREDGPEAPEGYAYFAARQYRDFRPMDRLFPCAIAGSLYRWYRDNRFCGRCGEPLADSEAERALVCPRCGEILYPKICPAVIVAVRNGERLLLTKYAGRTFKNYALIAGFSEIGESIEETVHREVLEEVGVRVKNLQFYKSQPWVFTDTLLMGFYCDLDGPDTITLQESELAVGVWVPREELPEDIGHVSLTGEMIEQFRLGLA
ncbi:MAG: NAD(+) diphosphatase [Oscillospiraceae bacterium]|nr:NAD(+) diphosphatase [Oscillospiraceae bacterium]